MTKANWLFWAMVATIVYIGLLIWQLGWTKIALFLSGTTQLNNVGDFLSGVFAPLALIWLVAAVLTQRQELNETRDQFDENQKVVDAQLKTINIQNALLAQQHELAAETARKTYKLSLFDKRFEIYNEVLQVHESLLVKLSYSEEPKLLRNLAERSTMIFSNEIATQLHQTSMECAEVKKFHDAHFEAIRLKHDKPDPAVESVRAEYGAMRNRLLVATSKPVLNNLMWSSLHISDEH